MCNFTTHNNQRFYRRQESEDCVANRTKMMMMMKAPSCFHTEATQRSRTSGEVKPTGRQRRRTSVTCCSFHPEVLLQSNVIFSKTDDDGVRCPKCAAKLLKNYAKELERQAAELEQFQTEETAAPHEGRKKGIRGECRQQSARVDPSGINSATRCAFARAGARATKKDTDAADAGRRRLYQNPARRCQSDGGELGRRPAAEPAQRSQSEDLEGNSGGTRRRGGVAGWTDEPPPHSTGAHNGLRRHHSRVADRNETPVSKFSLGEIADSEDMYIPELKETLIVAIARLELGDGVFVKRSGKIWTYAVLVSKDNGPNAHMTFNVNGLGSKKVFSLGQCSKYIRWPVEHLSELEEEDSESEEEEEESEEEEEENVEFMASDEACAGHLPIRDFADVRKEVRNITVPSNILESEEEEEKEEEEEEDNVASDALIGDFPNVGEKIQDIRLPLHCSEEEEEEEGHVDFMASDETFMGGIPTRDFADVREKIRDVILPSQISEEEEGIQEEEEEGRESNIIRDAAFTEGMLTRDTVHFNKKMGDMSFRRLSSDLLKSFEEEEEIIHMVSNNSMKPMGSAASLMKSSMSLGNAAPFPEGGVTSDFSDLSNPMKNVLDILYSRKPSGSECENKFTSKKRHQHEDGSNISRSLNLGELTLEDKRKQVSLTEKSSQFRASMISKKSLFRSRQRSGNTVSFNLGK